MSYKPIVACVMKQVKCSFIQKIKGETLLELRPSCERCNSLLPPESEEAMICSYECTFCKTCVETVLQGDCPNCGDNFCKRPIRSKDNLTDDPASTKVIYNPVK